MKLILAVSLLCFIIGCQPNEAIIKSGQSNTLRSDPSATLEPRKTSFEQDLAEMKDAGFDYIFVLRRKDGKPFDEDDRKFLRTSMPHEINRRVSSDDGKAFIFGSGFAIDIKSIRIWKERYLVEEHSNAVEKVVNKP